MAPAGVDVYGKYWRFGSPDYAGGTPVGSVPVVEPDANDTYSYAITAGDPGGAFAIDVSGNLTVADGTQLNFESQSVYTLTVQVVDDDGNSDPATITVNLNDVDEAPVIAPASFSVNLTAANATPVGSVPVAEPDANDTYSYAITAGDAGGAFAIDNAGNISVADSSQFDFALQPIHTLTVQVSDDDGNVDTTTITVGLVAQPIPTPPEPAPGPSVDPHSVRTTSVVVDGSVISVQEYVGTYPSEHAAEIRSVVLPTRDGGQVGLVAVGPEGELDSRAFDSLMASLR